MRTALLVTGLLAAMPAYALVLGGGDADKDCRLAFVGVTATAGASGVVCVDGDPLCDTDGGVDDGCRLVVGLCAGLPMEGCAPVTIDRVEVRGAPIEPPAVPASSGCGLVSPIVLAPDAPAVAATVRGYRGGELAEVDYVNLCCVSQADGLTAAACSVAAPTAAAGCDDLPARVERKFERAREAIAAAREDPAAAAKRLGRALKQAKRLRALGRRIANGADCGFALALMATHAIETIEAARAALADTAD